MRRFALLALLAVAGCQHARPADPRDAFFAQLSRLCGQSFEGRLASPSDPRDAAFMQPIVLQVRDCTAQEVRMPLAVGEDRSRTWVVNRASGQLTLRHDHRHPDGHEDVLSRYGGSTVAAGSAVRQEFPADGFSRDLFGRQGIPASKANVWALELKPGERLAYELNRPDRHVRLEFDLARPRPAGR